MSYPYSRIVQQLDTQLNIGASHVWEGAAGTPKVVRVNDASDGKKKEITLETSAWSSVEHSGDEEGIKTALSRLKCKKASALIGGKEYEASVTGLTIVEEKRDGGSARNPEYEYYIRTRITLLVTELETPNATTIRKVELEQSLNSLSSKMRDLMDNWRKIINDGRLTTMIPKERHAHLRQLDELAPKIEATRARLSEIRKELSEEHQGSTAALEAHERFD